MLLVLRDLGIYFAVMIAATSILSIPLTPATLIAAQSAPAWAVASVAACAATISALFDHWFVRRVFRLGALERMRRHRLFQRAERWATVAPFWTTAAFAGFPIPFIVVRVLVPLSGYPRARYAAAAALGRFPKIYVIATFGSFYRLPLSILYPVFGVTLLIALGIAIARYIRWTQRSSNKPTD